MKQLLILLCVGVMISACGGSAGVSGRSTGSSGSSAGGSFNPRGWFGRQNDAVIVQTLRTDYGTTVSLTGDRRPLVDLIVSGQAVPTKGGVIVSIEGLMDSQGAFDAGLVARNAGNPNEDGVIVLEARIRKSAFGLPGPTIRSREVQLGTYISKQKLDRAKAIRVLGARNQITVRRSQ